MRLDKADQLFPSGISRHAADEIPAASTATVANWDSVAAITMMNVVEDEFRPGDGPGRPGRSRLVREDPCVLAEAPAGGLMAASLRLHHMGFVVADIATAMPAFVRSMAAEWDGQIFEDPLQKAKVAFHDHAAGRRADRTGTAGGRGLSGAALSAAGRRHASPLL